MKIKEYLIENEALYENITKLIKFANILQISNAEIERTISSFSFIKNKFRTRLTRENCSKLLFIYKLHIS